LRRPVTRSKTRHPFGGRQAFFDRQSRLGLKFLVIHTQQIERAFSAPERTVVVEMKTKNLGLWMQYSERPDEPRKPCYQNTSGLLTWLKQKSAKRFKGLGTADAAPNFIGAIQESGKVENSGDERGRKVGGAV
jgi:hypothetical protein